ncbi:TSUP family transporter [Humitalea sp. 24SJ18S-53]|uniref:TSUP family transporter n=1 Tax=Humitalea sp. 24SJ18S-53 TaxID=3422307 RepID=UPI003D676338
MPIMIIALLTITVVGTSFLSGIFGMAGGLILIGILLALLPVADAMALHAVTQLASNGWRAASWIRHVRWGPVASYAGGCALAMVGWSIVRFVPERGEAMLMLGLSPLLVRLLPARFAPDAEKPAHGVIFGVICMSLMLLTGVSGPLLDRFFLGGKLERRQIVASKAIAQTMGHAAKWLYFGGLVADTGSVDPLMAGLAILASMVGTMAARPVLEAMTDVNYRRWAGWIITTISLYFVLHGAWLIINR